MLFINYILQVPTNPNQQSAIPQFLMLGGIILVFWLFMIRPQAKKAKEQKAYIDNLKKGDKVVTSAGIHGSIFKVNEDGTLQIEVSPGSYLKMEKSAISQELSLNANKASV